MRKKLFTFLLAIVASVSEMYSLSYDFKYNGDSYKILSNNTVEIIETNKRNLSIITIPSSATDNYGVTYAVTSIGKDFLQYGKVKEITIPNTINNINSMAFYQCKYLEKVIINDLNAWCNIKFVDFASNPLIYAQHLYLNNNEITELIIPEGTIKIGAYTFRGLSNTKSIIIPNTVTSIGTQAFAYCTGISSLNIPNSVTEIGENAFQNIPNIEYHGTATGSPWGANAINGIVDGYFVYGDEEKTILLSCLPDAVGNIIIPTGVTIIGDKAFYNCDGITSISIPLSVNKIGEYTFSSCDGIETISIPGSVKTIGSFAFSNCSKLTSVTLNEGLQIIRRWAFAECNNLYQINIPQSVDSIGDYVFEKCNFPIEDGCRYADTYLIENTDKTSTSIIIKDGTRFIGQEAFGDVSWSEWANNKIRSVTIPNSIEYIEYGAFANCSNLQEISPLENVKSIDNKAFYGCDLSAVFLSDKLMFIGEEAFAYGAKNIFTIDIPSSVVEIEKNAFSGIRHISYNGMATGSPWGAKHINGYFDGYFIYNDVSKTKLFVCNRALIGDAIIPNSVTSIETEAFGGCSGMASVTIPNSVTSIGGYAFDGCTGLKSLHISDIAAWCVISFNDTYANPLYYAHNLYLDDTKITNLVIPDSITNIKQYAFYNANIKSVKLEAIAPPSVFNNSFPENTKVYVPLGTLAAYKSTNWNNYDLRVFDLVTKEGEKAPTSFSVSFGDHTTKQYIASCGLEGGEAFAGNTIEYIGLEPENEYQNIPLFITTTGGDYMTMSCSFTTTALELTTKASKPVSSNTAILLAETNMSDAEVNCGFEWKRNDAPADMEGNKVYCPVASGQMAGRLKGLKDDVYYKYRAFYQSAAGNMYYGDWQYIFTGDVAVEFDPILYTYGATVVRENEATISGYALAGSEDFTEQGFEYWAETRANGGANAPRRMPAALGEHFFVQASGIALHATLTNLDAGTVYKYRVYGKVGDQYYYGAEQAFTTTGTYTPPTYTITFVNWDGSELQSSQVTEDNMPQYTGEMPERPADEQYTYTFSNWTPEIAPATEDATYTAIYTTSLREYLVTFLDEDGTEISSQYYKYGETPVAPADPVKESTDEYVYIFIGWSPAIVSVTADATYTATYEANSREGVNNIYLDPQAQKILINGQVLIQRGDKLYTLQGIEVK